MRLFTNKTIKRNKLSNTWSTVHWIPNYKSAKCLSTLRNPICWSCKSSRFPLLSKFPNWLIDDGLTLFSTWFCSSDNCYCFLRITCKLKIKQSATDLSQWLLFSNLNYLNTLKTLKKGYYFHEVRDKIFKILKPGLHK